MSTGTFEHSQMAYLAALTEPLPSMPPNAPQCDYGITASKLTLFDKVPEALSVATSKTSGLVLQ